MLGDLITSQTTNTLRRPKQLVSIGAGSVGLASISNPLSGGVEDPWARSVAKINVDVGLAPFVDIATVEIIADTQAPQVALDDEGTISLGYNDSTTELVFSAIVNNIGSNVHGSQHLSGVNGGVALSRLRINQSYEQQSAGDIVSDLAGQADVETDTVESGIDLPFYVIDDHYNAYQHIDRLARQSGFIAHFTIEGKLYFGPQQAGQAVHTFSYANDILELRVQQNNSSSSAVTVIGEGAAGSEGQDAWSWLIKDPGAVTSEAGDGKSRLISDAALRSSEACQAAADGRAARAAALALSGSILTAGVPAVVVGSTIEIADAPGEAMNGDFFVNRISHHYSKQHGFTSLIHFRKSGDSGGLLGGLL